MLNSVIDQSITLVCHVTDLITVAGSLGGLIDYVVYYSNMWADYGMIEF